MQKNKPNNKKVNSQDRKSLYLYLSVIVGSVALIVFLLVWNLGPESKQPAADSGKPNTQAGQSSTESAQTNTESTEVKDLAKENTFDAENMNKSNSGSAESSNSTDDSQPVTAPDQPVTTKPIAPAPQKPAISTAPNPKKKIVNGVPSYDYAPPMKIDTDKTYTATIKTNKGDIRLQLFAKDAPLAVNNFVFLARDKYYDGIIFHRIVQDFMIQTGDPLGKGFGGPGYQFADELNSPHRYEEGILAMANSGPNTNGSQFFIGSGPTVQNLNSAPNYTIFGKVIGGMEIVKKIAATPVGPSDGGEQSAPLEKVNIETILIQEK